MIAVLLALASIKSGGLQVTQRMRANPDVGISGGNGQPGNTLKLSFVSECFFIRTDVTKSATRR